MRNEIEGETQVAQRHEIIVVIREQTPQFIQVNDMGIELVSD